MILWLNTYRRLKKDAHATFSKSSIDTLPPTQASFTAIVVYALYTGVSCAKGSRKHLSVQTCGWQASCTRPCTAVTRLTSASLAKHMLFRNFQWNQKAARSSAGATRDSGLFLRSVATSHQVRSAARQGSLA